MALMAMTISKLKKAKNASKILQLKFSYKIVFGSGLEKYEGWTHTNIELLDITRRDDFLLYWSPGSRLAFLAEHVWEHLSEDEAKQANLNCFDFLKPGGYLRIAVPDGFHPNPEYIDAVRPEGAGVGSGDHKILYNYQSLSRSIKQVGFEVRCLEYWDERGNFNFQSWNSEDGHINRSKRFDPRNQDGSLTYTSLILDAIKS